MNKPAYFYAAVLLLVSTFVLNLSAQDTKPVSPSETFYSTSTSTNDLNALTTVKPHEEQPNAEKQQLLIQLRDAKHSGNTILKDQIQNRLDQINGVTPVSLIENSNVIAGQVTDSKPPFNSPDFMTSAVLPYGAGVWSIATQTVAVGQPNAGRMWAGIGIYGGASAADTARFYYSDNGGLTWNFAYYFFFGNASHFRGTEMDFEMIYDGTVMWIYGVVGYTDAGGRTYSLLYRFNTTANTFNGYTLLWPGNATATNLYYNPRITSDNSNYTSNAYVYLTCSFDSTTGATHMNRQKFAILTSPFVAAPTINYSSPGTLFNGGFYWNSSGLVAGTYLYTDIGYCQNASNVDRLVTVYNVPGSNNYNLYLAWSDDYGATVTAANTLVIAEANVDYGARIAFNAGTNHSGMIAYVRQFSGTDWDPYYRSSTDVTTWPNSGYIDASTLRTRRVDVIAPRNGANLYKVAYTQDSTNGQYGYYTGGTPGTWNQPNRLAVTPNNVDTSFGKIVAGFKNGGGDDCFAVFALLPGGQIYASRLCQTTVGIGNNNTGIPSMYSLEQNYPNPFNPSTTIKFGIPNSGFVKVTVFDITGKEVATLVNEQLNAGSYNYSFDASNLASGVYLYKIQANDFTAVKKMLLVK